MARTAIWWVRTDLRLGDNAALAYALERAEVVVPLVVPASDAHCVTRAATCAWQSRSLAALDEALRERGSRLIVARGPIDAAIAMLAHVTGATLVVCSRDPAPPAQAEEDTVRRALSALGVSLVTCGGQLLVPPDSISTAGGEPFRVFTPFFRTWKRSWEPEQPLPTPATIPAPAEWPASEHLPHVTDTIEGAPPLLDSVWKPGEAGGLERLDAFVPERLPSYDVDRDRPDLDGTSRLSPHLAFGEVSTMQVASTALSAVGPETARPFLRQLAWREFAYHILLDFPDLATQPWRPEFAAMPWRDDDVAFDAWLHGRTGFPLVDAGMRELAATGWMHNRVRLVAGSFLAKDLLIPWQHGEVYFGDRLVDFDPASNAFNWQWVAGSGADASPYFRIFNPWLQGVKFDSDGAYVRTWVPELAGLSSRWIHTPWAAPAEELQCAGVVPGESYPHRIVDHAASRQRALAAFEAVRAERIHARAAQLE